ncbi:MAG: segregation and condensation protein A, partial [Solirubrobacteraceae bacterium]
AQRYRSAAAWLTERLAEEEGHRFRSAPLPSHLRKASLKGAESVYDPAILAGAIGDLLQVPPPVNVSHMTSPKVTVAERLAHLRALLSRGRFTFSDAVGRADRVTVAVTLYALLELYKQGEATWTQDEPFAEITVEALVAPNRLPNLAERRAAAHAAAAERLTA